jgi:hypothetical protein
MAKIKKLGEEGLRFTCDCGLVTIISDDADGKIMLETITPPKPKEGDNGKVHEGKESGSGSGEEKKGFLARHGVL